MLVPQARGTLSAELFDVLRGVGDRSALLDAPVESDDDLQISLWALYELSYRGFDDAAADLEWDPTLLTLRARLEQRLESTWRERGPDDALDDPFPDALLSMIEHHDGRSVARFVQRDASREQVLELMRQRTIYHLKEADPTSWVLPRLPVRSQAALAALQYDEYGAGEAPRLHRQLFARGLAACGLDDKYGAYIDEASTIVLEQNNAMSMFGLHRRLRGAALGHLAAFEATSSLPSRRMAAGLRRVGLPEEMAWYYDEHVEADAVHEQLAARMICGTLAADEPETAGTSCSVRSPAWTWRTGSPRPCWSAGRNERALPPRVPGRTAPRARRVLHRGRGRHAAAELAAGECGLPMPQERGAAVVRWHPQDAAAGSASLTDHGASARRMRTPSGSKSRVST